MHPSEFFGTPYESSARTVLDVRRLVVEAGYEFVKLDMRKGELLAVTNGPTFCVELNPTKIIKGEP